MHKGLYKDGRCCSAGHRMGTVQQRPMEGGGQAQEASMATPLPKGRHPSKAGHMAVAACTGGAYMDKAATQVAYPLQPQITASRIPNLP